MGPANKMTANGMHTRAITYLLPLPLFHDILLDPKILQYSRGDSIGELFERSRTVIPGRGRGENGRACVRRGKHVLQHDAVVWHLARNENQRSPLFQAHVGRAREQIVACSVCDSPKRAHAAWNYDHSVVSKRSARRRREVILAIEMDHAFEFVKVNVLLQLSDLMGLVGRDQVDFLKVLPGVVQESERIDSSTGAGYPEDEPPSCHGEDIIYYYILDMRRQEGISPVHAWEQCLFTNIVT